MTAIVLGGVCRYTIHQTFNGADLATVVDMHLDTDGGAARGEAIEDQAQILLTQWVQHISPSMSSSWTLQKCSWVDLNSADGEVGETTTAQEGVTVPVAGAISGDSMPGNVAYLVKKTTTGGRRARHGRWFLGGLAESGCVGNAPAPSILTGLNAQLGQLLSDINQSGRPPLGVGTGLYDSELVVVHLPAGGGPTYTHVDSLTLDSLLATQRDRLRP